MGSPPPIGIGGAVRKRADLVLKFLLINPIPNDGLLRLRDGARAPADSLVTLQTGALEASNVNTVEAMVRMIELARQFETQIKVMKSAEENDRASAQLMRLG